jgi:hypothetical protein
MAMALTAGELCEIVWGETSALGVGRADGGGEVNAVRALVARLAAARQGVGFPRRTPLPRTDDARYGETARAIMAIADAAKDAIEPQRRLIIWIAGKDSSQIETGTNPPPPEPWDTLAAGAVVNQFHTQLPASGKLVDVFSRGALAGDADGRPFVNALTGTGLPEGAPLAATAPPPQQTPIASWIPWTLGIVGVVLFVIGGAAAALTGASLGTARNSLHATAPAYQKFMLEEVGKACLKTNVEFPGAALPKVCDGILTTDRKAIDNEKLSANRSTLFASFASCAIKSDQWDDAEKSSCPVIWPAAVAADQEHGSPTASYAFTALSWASGYLTGMQRDVGVASIVTPYLCSLVGVAALLVALGLGTKGRAVGVWIDTRNRVSLARAQVTLWTLVVLSGYFAISMFNVGFAVFLGWPPDLSNYVSFPSMPPSIWTALGISVGSTMISKLLLTSKDNDDTLEIADGARPPDKRGLAFFGAGSSGLDKRESPSQASLADLFMGEENADSDTVDVSRLQNVLISIMLVSSYLLFLIELMSGIRMEAILSASNAALFKELPNLGVTFTSLLGASHATYLVSKAHNSKDLSASSN